MRNTTILNADWTHLSCVSWKKGLRLVEKGKAEILEIYEDIVYMDTAHREYFIPRVICIKKFVNAPRRPYSPSRHNIFLRDNYTCAYCLSQLSSEELSIDHIMPKSRGGKDTWENLVTACKKCNSKKGDRTPREAGMPLWKKQFPDT